MRVLSPALFFLLPGLMACSQDALDRDGDFLSDAFEERIGTRRDLRDSDGDGFTDAEEHLTYFDAMENGDHPYETSYPRLALPEEILPDGWAEGDISGTWEREDHLGQEIRLHDFFGNVILIAVLAEYLDTAQDDALEHQDAYEDYRDRGFMVIHLLVDGEPEDTAPDTAGWASDFNLDFAIIDERGQSLLPAYVEEEEGTFTIPSYTVIGRDMVIRDHDNTEPFETDLIEELLDEPVPDVPTWLLPANVLELREKLGLRRYTDDEANIDHKLASPDMNANLDGDLANAVEGNTFSPVDGEGNASGQPFGGTTCDSGSASLALFPLLLLSPLRRRR